MPGRWIVPLSLLVAGGASLIWQVASIRSLLAGLRGNELVVGLALAVWLLLMAGATVLVDALLGTHAPLWRPRPSGDRRRPGEPAPAGHGPPGAGRALRGLRLTLLLAPVGILASLILQRLTLPTVGELDQLSGPGTVLGATLLSLAPACLPLGGIFALTARLAREGRGESWAARIYFWESAGTALAGLLCHLVLSWFSLELSALLAGATCLITGLMLPATAARRGPAPLVALLLGTLACLTLIPGLPFPGAHLLAPRGRGYQILEERNSPHAALAVLRRGDQTLWLASGQLAFSDQDDPQAEAEVHLPLLAHSAPGRVLMVGGGLGGGVREALKHPVTRLDYVELDPLLVQLARRWGGAGLRRTLDDPRVHLIVGDARLALTRHTASYDAILIGLPGPTSALINRFYTEEFFRSARRALRPGGLIQVTLAGTEGYLTDETALTHATVLATLRRSFVHVHPLPGARTALLAGRDAPPTLAPTTLLQRQHTRGVVTRFQGETELRDRTLPFRRELYLERLAGVRPLPNTDLHPSAHFHASLLWLALSHPDLARVLGQLLAPAARLFWPIIAAGFLLTLTWGLLRRRIGRRAPDRTGSRPDGAARQGWPPVGSALLVVGLTGLALELALLLACQEVRGVIYQELGLLLATFMVGIALGATAGRRLAAAFPGRALQLAVAGMVLAALVALAVLHLALRFPGAALPLFLLGLGLLGAAVGACYSPAVILLETHRGPAAVAYAYAWDLLGAAAGALLATALGLPLLGLDGTALTGAALCLGLVPALRAPPTVARG